MSIFPKILNVSVIDERHLELQYDDSKTFIIDMAPIVAIGNLATQLAKESYLRRVQISHRGRSLLWPNGLELCADALRLQGESETKSKRRRKATSALVA